ncbi:MAG: leukotriene-A4 hydrolase [Acidobacteriota bacterium]|nr:leukotriene-A4 hydrolase [Acidobacteriota bacterium]
MTRRLLAAALLLGAASTAPSAATATGPDSPAIAAAPADPHSFSRPAEVAVRHLELDLTVDFEGRRLAGSATLTLDRRDPAAQTLRLDTRDLEIAAVHLDGDSAPAPFTLAPAVPIFGQELAIALGPKTRSVRIEYRTRPEAAALQWLAPEQTGGGKSPFLFTQSQAILARTWVPCQDSPGVRMTYSASIRVPKELLAVMSATNPTARNASGLYRFEMTHPIPSYLLALAVGDLEFRPLGGRSGVYAEPAVVGKAAWEFADTEKMIAAAEKLYGPYRWERYDLLVLPPSFPFGGMENPRLTFATPTILAGDRSLVALVAHELAHSWSGNLVTNATWNDFWLNEGFTNYFESRIMEAVYGRDFAEMQAQLGKRDLEAFVREIGADNRETWLFGDLAGRDPDDAPGAIVYDKGYFFLRHLEETVGREKWDRFLQDYFTAHAFQSMTTAGFLGELQQKLLDPNPAAAAKADVQAWVYGPGLPASIADPKSPAFGKVDAELARLAAGTPPRELATAGWVTQQWQHFLRNLTGPLDAAGLAELDGAFHFTDSGNAEIAVDWFQRAIAAGCKPAYPALERFLLSVGRRKFIGPLYAALAKTPEGLAFARDVYARARPGYHPLAQLALDGLLNAKEAVQEDG